MARALEAVPSVGKLGEVSLAEVLGDLLARRASASIVLTEADGAEHTVVVADGAATKVATSVVAPPPRPREGDDPGVTTPGGEARRALLALVATITDGTEYAQFADLDLLGARPGVACDAVPLERAIWAAVRGRADTPAFARRVAWFSNKPLHADAAADPTPWHMGKAGRALLDALRERPRSLDELSQLDALAGKRVGAMVLALSIGGVVSTDPSSFAESRRDAVAVVGSDAWIAAHFGAPESMPKDPRPPPERTPKHLWLAFGLSLAPLVATLTGIGGDVSERLAKTIAAHPELGDLWETGDKDKILQALPEHRLDGAWLPSGALDHWGYAVIAALLFLGAAWLTFERGFARIKHVALTTAFTATCGIALLLLFQLIAQATQGVWIRGGNIAVLFFYVVKFIGFSYSAAMDPDNGFFLSMIGFTFGVGLCEELTKALPLLWQLRRPWRARTPLDWRTARMWMLASGVGFGVAEGVMYASDYYNGIHGVGIYVVRFVSCVALHAVWSATVGLSLYRRRFDLYGTRRHWSDLVVSTLRALAGPMVLHGLYDTLLKKELGGLALAVAVASFGVLVWHVARARGDEADATPDGVPA